MLKAVSTKMQTPPCFPPLLSSGENDSFKPEKNNLNLLIMWCEN